MIKETDVQLENVYWQKQNQSYETLVCEEESKINVSQGIKLGWIEGVLNPCLLSIWGVMLFLRLPWMVGQAGIFDSILIIFISLIIITITTFSLSAISTNGRIKGGGLYFIISRSIGPEFGASIGILLVLANTIVVALNTIGFCLTLKSLLQSFDVHIMDSDLGFILIGLIMLLVMGVLCCAGMDDEAKIQDILLVFIVGAIINVIIGSFFGPTSETAIASGYTGFSATTFKKNWYSDYRFEDNIQQSFFTIFAIFFPSVTGIQAGANISGDLKDPSSSIPKGTLLSIVISITSYVILIVVTGAVHLREASGYTNELQNELYLNCSTRICSQGLYHNENVQSFDELVHDQEIKTGVCSGVKLGWVKGVLVPCLLSIWGVMLFLKMPWILGQAGIFDSVVIIFVSLIIILITTFSLSAISTNGKIKGGGLYFIISRSIGPELGASIGILFAFANTISVAMNSIGFCLSLQQLLQSYDIHIIDEKFEFKTLGVTSIIVLSIVCCIGMDREAEIQNTLLMVILVGIFNVIVGSFMGPTSVGAKASGFTGLSMDTFEKNWHSDYRFQGNTHHSIFTIFAFFFPSVTGIQAGANISGDLKDPSSAIPKGTLLSILITITSYVILIIVPGAVQLREASGITDEYIFNNGTHLDCSSRNCTKGLHYDSNLFQSISLWPITIYFGCFGATLSTALTALISVPKIVQRMGQDDIYPLFKYLAKGYGKSQEPYRAHVFAMFVSSALLIIVDDLNDLAPLISTIYLSAYALLNVCTFHVAYFKPLGWRPSYTFYNKWLSLTGAVICISLMIFIDKQMSAIVACFICVLYKIAARKHDVLNWGSSKQTQQIKAVLNSVYKANTVQYHVKNFLPNVMVLSGNPESRKKLISLAHLITKNNGVQTCVNAEKRPLTTEQKEIYLDRGIKWLKNAEIKSLYVVIDNVELDVATHMVYSCGHGQLRTNMVLVGYKSDWLNCPYEDLRTFLNIFNVANVNGIALIMVRVSSTEGFKNQNVLLRESKQSNEIDTLHQQSNRNNNSHQKVSDSSLKINDGEFLFTNKLKKSHGTIDVWWLYNDGGLALLIACILRSSTTWKHCKFRIFGVTDRVECLSKEKIKLNQLLSMYRVHFDYLDIILTSTTNPTTMTYFTSLLERVHPEGNQFDEYKVHEKNIAETLFLRDLIELHSLKSDLIILSTPRTNEQMNTLFMCWIETITRGLPPCIIINGNTGPVLTANA